LFKRILKKKNVYLIKNNFKMKNFILAVASIAALLLTTTLSAQPSNKEKLTTEETTVSSSSEEVAVLQSFKANKTQRRVIRKMKKYVTPKIIARGTRTTALEGKKVTVQLSLDTNGAITNLQIVKGFEESLDAKVLKYIRAYDAENPLANSNLEKPTTIQIEVPLVGKASYMN
jgi:outer membrane biosynthesis protein TonB